MVLGKAGIVMTKSRIKVKGLQVANNPTFEAGSTHIAQATLTNPTTNQFTYDVELYFGITKAGTSGVGSITIPAGDSLIVDFTLVMPVAEDTYPVYLDVSVAGELIAHYQAIEDVVVVALFDPWVYDFNGDGYIDDYERTKATQDYFDGIITKNQLFQVLNLPSPPAPPPFNPWSYDFNGNGVIDTSELMAAANDYYAGKITKSQLDQVSALWQG